jgi:hypothetical protein
MSLPNIGETQNARSWLLSIFVVYFFVLLGKVSKMEEVESIPQEIFEEAQEATQRLLPEKSKEHCEKEFAEFNKWREQRQVGVINEEVMLSYF